MSVPPGARRRMAVAAAVVLTVATAPASAEGKAVIQAASRLLEGPAAPLIERLRAEACRLLLATGAQWPARTQPAKAVRSWT